MLAEYYKQAYEMGLPLIKFVFLTLYFKINRYMFVIKMFLF